MCVCAEFRLCLSNKWKMRDFHLGLHGLLPMKQTQISLNRQFCCCWFQGQLQQESSGLGWLVWGQQRRKCPGCRLRSHSYGTQQKFVTQQPGAVMVVPFLLKPKFSVKLSQPPGNTRLPTACLCWLADTPQMLFFPHWEFRSQGCSCSCEVGVTVTHPSSSLGWFGITCWAQ